MADTLFHKVWNAHAVRTLPSGQTQLFVGLHLIHEVTSPQAFDMLRQHGWTVAFPERTFATVDHIVPTQRAAAAVPRRDGRGDDVGARAELPRVRHPAVGRRTATNQGIVHVIGPELGLTQPGMTIACGDSHTSTHGALGAIAFGIGTSQVRDVLASQCLALDPLKVRRIDVNGALRRGVYAKDVILTIIRRLGVQGGVGFAYEYGGTTIDAMTIDERMTICNMSIEGGARVGYVNPDDTTFAFLRGRPFAPQGEAFDRAVAWWRQIASDRDAPYDDRVALRRGGDRADGHLGHQPRPVGRRQRTDRRATPNDEALAFMGFRPGRARRRARGSTSPSSARAPTAASRISRRRRGSSAATTSRRMSRRWSCPGRRRCGRAAEARGLRRDLHRRRLRMARRRLLDVPRHEPGQARRPPGLRVVVEPQLQGTAGQPDRPHAADEPGDGRRGGDRRRSRRRPRTMLEEVPA